MRASPYILTPLIAAFTGCDATGGEDLDTPLLAWVDEMGITALAAPSPVDAPVFNLGEALFFDRELSGNRDVSCATCHHPALASADGLSLTIGTGGRGLGPERSRGRERSFGARNSPDLGNRGASDFLSFFWDGRVGVGGRTPQNMGIHPDLSDALAQQGMLPVLSELEMRGQTGDRDVFGQRNELAGNLSSRQVWDRILTRLSRIAGYRELFRLAFPSVSPSNISFEHVGVALAAYQRQAFSFTDTPWDAYLRGDRAALSPKAKRGALLFFGKAGCSRCHRGQHLTDFSFHNIGVPPLSGPEGDDRGRERANNDTNDRHRFRTPPLRNVALTGPWFHNGTYNDLNAVIRHHLAPLPHLNAYQGNRLRDDVQQLVAPAEDFRDNIGRTISADLSQPGDLAPDEIQDLVVFLQALTDPRATRQPVPASVPSGLPVDR